MKPFRHARNSAKKYGGKPADYQDIHDFIDSTKIAIPDLRHRALLHNAFGCFLVEKLFWTTRVNSDNRTYSPRDVAEDHIIEDLGFIPTLEKCFEALPLLEWYGGRVGKVRYIKNEKID